MNARIVKIILVMLVVCTLAACSSKGNLVMNKAITQEIPSGKTLSLVVEPNNEKVRLIHKEVISRIREKLFVKLVSESVFRQVVHVPEPADYQMKVKLQGARKVSTAARIWLGVFAGTNNLSANVKLYDDQSDQLVTEFDVQGASAAHLFSGENTLDDAIREAVDQIIQVLR